jgi:hypothetical protein
MARGNNAKIEVQKILIEAFGDNYIGEIDKKIYVWADDGAEKVQIALSMTCPKTFVEPQKAPTRVMDFGGDLDFEAMSEIAAKAEEVAPAEVSAEEQQNIAMMLARIGL